jgi:hypothetical protein
MRDGLSRLRRAKQLDGTEGEGVREFMRLVLKSTEEASTHLCGETCTRNGGLKASTTLVEREGRWLKPGGTLSDKKGHAVNCTSA